MFRSKKIDRNNNLERSGDFDTTKNWPTSSTHRFDCRVFSLMKTILPTILIFLLGVEGSIQTFILWINPIATTLLFFGISLYFKKVRTSLIVLFIIDF